MALLLLHAVSPVSAYAIGPVPCPWVVADNAFRGGALEQALCLLAPSAKGGRIVPLTSLPATFDALVGSEFLPRPQSMEQFMRARGLAEGDVGGPVSLRISLSEGVPAQYFVLHGLSGHKDGRGHVGSLKALPVAWHVAVAQDGSSRTLQDFFHPLCATRFEENSAGRHARGRFLHVVLVSEKRGQASVVSESQYQRLADIYIAASARAERWLIPVFSGVLENGQRGGASSPAGFDLEKWAAAVRDSYRIFLANS